MDQLNFVIYIYTEVVGTAYRVSFQKALKDKERLVPTLDAIDQEIENMEKGNVMPLITLQRYSS
jgi:hypothetical protein